MPTQPFIGKRSRHEAVWIAAPGTACCALALVLGGLACASGEEETIGPTASVASGELRRLVVATGTLEPEKLVDVRPRISGIIEKLHVEAGDLVKKDQPLLEIDRELLQVQLREARAQFKTSQVEARYAKTALARAKKLNTGGTMPDQGFEDAEARYERAVASVEGTRATIASLNVQIQYATVVAPMAGRILDVHVEEGSAVSSVMAVTGGTPLLSLAATTSLHLEGLVDENEIATVRIGQPAHIRTEAFGEEKVFQGRVSEISPIGKRVQNVTYFEVEVAVEDPDESLLLPRMSGDAEIITEVAKDVLWVPETALQYEGEAIYVERMVPSGEAGTERIAVELGIVEGDRVQLVKGPAAGDVVVLR